MGRYSDPVEVEIEARKSLTQNEETPALGRVQCDYDPTRASEAGVDVESVAVGLSMGRENHPSFSHHPSI